MTFFRSYFDESGKFQDHRVISFCGVMGSPDSLKAFNHAWDDLLRINQMPYLHVTHAFKCSEPLSPAIRRESALERCESLKPFVDCVLNNLDMGIAISIDVEAYTKWPKAARKRVGGSDDPAYFAFLQGTQALKFLACRDDDHVSMMCDEDEGTVFNFYELYKRVKKLDKDLRKKLVALSFSDDRFFPALQAADMIAALIRKESLKIFGHHTHDFGPLFEHLVEHQKGQKLKWCQFIGDPSTMGDIGNHLGRIRGARSPRR